MRILFLVGIATAASLDRRQTSLLEGLSKAITRGFGPIAQPPEQTATVPVPELTAVVNLPGTPLRAGQVRQDELGSASPNNTTAAAKTTGGPVIAGVAKPSDQLTRIVPST